MKTIAGNMAAMLLLFISIAVHGQQPATGNRAKMEAQGLKKQLSLTDAQAAQCEEIIKKYSAQLTALKQTKGDSTQTTKRQQLVKKRNNELKAVLTKEQQTNFDKWMEEKQRHRGKAMRRDSIGEK